MKTNPANNLRPPLQSDVNQRLRPRTKEQEAARQVAENFESIFVNQMISAMRNTVHDEGIMPLSHAEKVYQNLLDTEYAQAISQSEQLGLAQSIYEQLLRESSGQ